MQLRRSAPQECGATFSAPQSGRAGNFRDLPGLACASWPHAASSKFVTPAFGSTWSLIAVAAVCEAAAEGLSVFDGVSRPTARVGHLAKAVLWALALL